MWRITLAFSILATSTSITSVVASTHYVSHGGTNVHPYTSWSTATDSILLAIAAADEWDTVRFGPGLFTADTLGLKKGLVFMGAGRDSTRILHNGNDPQCIYLVDSCTLQGIHLRGKTDTSVSGDVTFHLLEGVVAETDQSAIVRDCRFSDMNKAIQAFFTDQIDPAKRVVIEGNEFSNFFEAVIYWFCSSRVRGNKFIVDYSDIGNPITQYDRVAEISHNVFLKSVYFSDPAIQLEYCDSIYVRNNIFICPVDSGEAIGVNRADQGYPTQGTIESNLCLGGYGGITSSGGNIRIRNNIITKATMWALYYDTLSTTPGYVGYNLFWDNKHQFSGDMAFLPDPGNLFADPMFVDSLDFHLQAFSPAIDAGDPSVLDADGSRSDIGPYGGPFGETYTYLDLPPTIPRRFVGTPSAIQIALSWSKNHEADFYRYELYRDTLPILAADSELLLVSLPSDTVFVDSMIFPGARYHYRLRAVDAQANASDLTDELEFIAAGVNGDDPLLPGTFILHPNYPNPFNAATRVAIDAPASGRLDLVVYDVLGRKVSTLHGGPVSAGRHVFDWRPDGAGSGVYFIVARFNGLTRIGKLLLLK